MKDDWRSAAEAFADGPVRARRAPRAKATGRPLPAPPAVVLCGVAAFVLALALFLPWFAYGADNPDLSSAMLADDGVVARTDADAFQVFDGVDLLLFLLAAGGLAQFGLELAGAPRRASTAIALATLGGVLCVQLLYRVGIDEPGPNEAIGIATGAYLGLLATLALTAAAVALTRTPLSERALPWLAPEWRDR